MFIRSASLRDFRSWDELDLTLSLGPTVFLGSNGHGKTNILEALWYLATLHSHRVATDAPLIRQGASQAHIGATVVNQGRELRVDLELNAAGANRARLGRTRVRPREILGVLGAVLFAPEDLALLRGDPSERRRYLDELAATRIPRLAAVRADYDRVLRQRNALLKSARQVRTKTVPGTLDAWDGQLTALGGELLAERLRLVHDLGPLVTRNYQALAPESTSATIGYRSAHLPAEMLNAQREPQSTDAARCTEFLVEALATVRDRELERGISLVGPHRDELALELGGGPAKGFASHGESWSFVLSLRLAAFDLLGGLGSRPVLLLDDVFAELDGWRRVALARVATGAEQVLLTAAVIDDVPEQLRDTIVVVGRGGEKRTSRIVAEGRGAASDPAGDVL